MVECTLFITHCLRLNLQLHTIDFVRTCRISSFCTVAWQLARFQLTRRIAQSLGDSWASCFNQERTCPNVTNTDSASSGRIFVKSTREQPLPENPVPVPDCATICSIVSTRRYLVRVPCGWTWIRLIKFFSSQILVGGDWKRKYGKRKYWRMECASSEYVSTNIQGWKMQVRKTQVRVCNGGKRKYSNLKSILKSLWFSSLAFQSIRCQ